jgi:chromate transport protein ChrA
VRTEIRAASLLVLIALVWGILRSRREFLQRPDLLVAAAAALVSWLLVFSPIGWYHYYAYLMPFWGWLAWMWGRSRASSAAVLGIVALNWVPLCAQTGLRLPEPLRSHVLAGNLLLMGLAMAHILKASRQRI